MDFDILSRSAADVIINHFGKRDAEGAFTLLAYRDPTIGAAEPYRWPYDISAQRFEQVYDESTGETSLKELCNINVPTVNVLANHVTAFNVDAVFLVNGEEWQLDEAESLWGEDFVTFGLIRQPLVSKNELRSAPN